mmetsp:Transcript_38371/g.90205  ORF Transcript_38371/g.90205 Transcript_38371/m.90205 type:complete len:88 (-) Transcript_38371:1761-2024(-)
MSTTTREKEAGDQHAASVCNRIMPRLQLSSLLLTSSTYSRMPQQSASTKTLFKNLCLHCEELAQIHNVLDSRGLTAAELNNHFNEGG